MASSKVSSPPLSGTRVRKSSGAEASVIDDHATRRPSCSASRYPANRGPHGRHDLRMSCPTVGLQRIWCPPGVTVDGVLLPRIEAVETHRDLVDSDREEGL